MSLLANDTEGELLQPRFQLLGPSSVARRMTLKPGMCGPNSLFVGQVGDWTWETVSALCGTNVFTARDATGASTYLAFYYYHIQASPELHLGSFTFGDRIDITSSLFNVGSESVLTLHKIRRASLGGFDLRPIDCEEFYERQQAGCMYIENFNRWVTRSSSRSNEDLVKSSPLDFQYSHLPVLPARYSPRTACNLARRQQTFLEPHLLSSLQAVDELSFEYRVDLTRDINGVGLMYFAAYFSIIDSAILKLWRQLDRSDTSFLSRSVTDHKLCYLGNANVDSVFTVKVRRWRMAGDRHREIFDVVIQDRETQRTIAVSTVHMQSEEMP